MSELVVRGLEKSFGSVRVLDGLDLDVPAGSLAAVLGPSGCGKTTLLRVVAGFEVADGGTVMLAGIAVAGRGVHVPPERRRVGVVPQEGALFPHLSVAGNVGFGLPRSGRRAPRVAELLELVGLGGYGDRMPYELSGGQQQRVALARALAPDPALVLLDEPFSSLDTGLRASVREDVRTALRTAGATAVLVTHDQEEALSMADLVAVMASGRIAQAAPPGELYTAPSDLGVATFVGDAVVLDAVATAAGADSALGRLELHDTGVRGPGRVVVRPEQVLLDDTGNGVVGTVTGTAFYGHDAVVRVSVSASDGPVPVAARCQGLPPGVEIGDSVGLRVVGPVTFFPAA
ncbi:MAG TPA: ABC transporter ATP-binding protein [Jiangellaceae bacterium]|nr:ABC transporter ATP-binding protein [Jiangellaceae bacterium]